MKVKLAHPLFIKMLTASARAIDNRAVIPILSGIHIEVHDDTLDMIATNHELTIIHHLKPNNEKTEDVPTLQILEDGAVVAPAKLLLDITRRMKADSLEITTDHHQNITLTQGDLSYQIHGMNPEEYPLPPTFEESTEVRLESEAFRELLDKVSFAASRDESRPVLKGVRLMQEGKKLIATATDSHRLAESNMTLTTDEVVLKEPIILPAKHIPDIIALLSEEKETVYLQTDLRTLALKGQTFDLFLRLLNGTYPDTRMIIPKTGKSIVETDREPLLQALERALVIAQYNRNQTVRLTADEGTIMLYTVHPELGTFSEPLSGSTPQGEALSIWFNGQYLLDALKHLKQDRIVFWFNGALSPFVVKEKAADHILHLIVPVKTH
ncbi:MAG: DNA polymerase III beta subunit [Candidatus Carbobacillus altaicus]|uniref:Beta sliding clamp n=1 Tax=Candidatus Carbonibacillus altaicus TaxID=2163959 RepID=A0A2R6Y207_9BACL|nr:MAG: DNA polymerase III beta subunit [Candidatus Carbobacillus altaicus]